MTSIDRHRWTVALHRRALAHPIVFIVLLWIMFYMLPIGNRGLWNPDEPRYTQVAWEMARSDNYLVPTMNQEIYGEKPPLFFWLTVLLGVIVDFEAASRWVSALFSLGSVLLAYDMGKRTGSRSIGLTAALVLMSCGLFALLATTGNIDTTLTFFTTLSLWGFLRWTFEAKRRYLVLSYAACGLGILAKGPMALLIPWLSFGVWEGLRRRRGQPARFGHLLWGPLLALVITAAWLVPACYLGGEAYTRYLLITQNFGRAVQSFAHERPFYYYLVNLPLDTLPWFLVFLFAVPLLPRFWRAEERRLDLLLVWCALIFILFSAVSGKRERYLLPLFPAFSVLIAHAVDRWDRVAGRTTPLCLASAVVFAATMMLVLFPFLAGLLARVFPVLAIFPAQFPDGRILAVVLMGAAALAVFREIRRHLRGGRLVTAAHLTALAFLLLVGIGQVYYVPAINPVKTARDAARRLAELVPPGGRLAFLERRYDNAWNFYLDYPRIPVVPHDRLTAESGYDVIIAREKDLPKIEAVLASGAYTVAHIEPVGGKTFAFVTRRRDGPHAGQGSLAFQEEGMTR